MQTDKRQLCRRPSMIHQGPAQKNTKVTIFSSLSQLAIYGLFCARIYLEGTTNVEDEFQLLCPYEVHVDHSPLPAAFLQVSPQAAGLRAIPCARARARRPSPSLLQLHQHERHFRLCLEAENSLLTTKSMSLKPPSCKKRSRRERAYWETQAEAYVRGSWN